MLTPNDAGRLIAESMPLFETERVSLSAAVGRVLRQTVRAERDQPPFDRVTMDGVAIHFASFADGRRQFPIASTQHAGDPMRPLDDPGRCAEVMTGSVLPDGADTVVPVERLSVSNGVATLDADYEPAAGQFIHRQGSDHRAGINVLTPGTTITAMDVAILASCGLAELSVARMPAVRVISTGNELVPAGAAISPHQIRLSNGPALKAMLEQQGFHDSKHDHLVDEPALLEDRIAAHLQAADVLVLSGGVSMGKADFVPQVLEKLGVKRSFHRISQRPGKPMWFGTGPDGQAVFALPGNPVSSIVCCRQYVLPALFAACGRDKRAACFASLDEDVSFKPSLTCFLPVRVHSSKSGRLTASPVPTNTSGDFTALGGTDGYVELAADQQDFAAGSAVPYHPWDAP